MTLLWIATATLLCAASPIRPNAEAAADGGAPSPAGDAGEAPALSPVDVDVAVVPTDAGFSAVLDGSAGAHGIEPPLLLADSPAIYPEALREEGASAEIVLRLLVDESGRVAEVSVERGGDPLFEQAALEAARKLAFEPARMNGVPVAVRLEYSYRFQAPPKPAAAAAALPRGTLRGLVREKGLRTPLAGATVNCFEALTETGADGRFELSLTVGMNPCRVTVAGHRPFTFLEQLKAGEVLDVVYGLEPLRINPYETVVVGERERTEVSRITLRGQELREVPGTMGDPFRAVMLMPGVSSIMSGVAYPVVRGTAPAATGYFLDGVRVPLLYHLMLGPAVVHPDLIESVDFYPGAPPPEYGRLLGGAIDGKVRRPRDDRWHGTVYADLINAGGLVEYPVAKTETNFTVAGRISYTAWLTAALANLAMGSNPDAQKSKLVLDFWDYQARVEQVLWGGRLRLFAFGSNDKVGLDSDSPSVSTASETVLFHRIDLRYRHSLAGGDFEAGLTWGLDLLGTESRSPVYTNRAGAPETSQMVRNVLSVDETTWRARARWDRPLSERLRFSLGADFDRLSTSVTDTGNVDQTSVDQTLPVAVGLFAGLWSELAWQSADQRWRIAPGLRVDVFHLVSSIDRFSADPRLTVRRSLDDHWTLKAGAGLFHQQPTALIQLPIIDVDGLIFGLQEGAQFDVGAEWKGASGLQASADVYFNPLLRTLELEQGLQDGSTTVDQFLRRIESSGYATGLELMVRHPLGKNWFGWISYTLQRSVRRTTFERLDGLGASTGTATATLPYTYDQTHVFNAVVSYKFSNNWTLGATLHFNTGRPEAGNMTSTTMREGVGAQGQAAWIKVSRDQVDRLPPFWRIDVRVAKSWSSDLYNLELYLDVLNASMQSEVIAFDYQTASATTALQKKATSIPIILPILGVKGTY